AATCSSPATDPSVITCSFGHSTPKVTWPTEETCLPAPAESARKQASDNRLPRHSPNGDGRSRRRQSNSVVDVVVRPPLVRSREREDEPQDVEQVEVLAVRVRRFIRPDDKVD